MNKYGDEIADGFVRDVERDGFEIASDGVSFSVLWRHVTRANATEVALSVVGDTLSETRL